MTPCANQLSGWEFFTALFMAGLFRFAAAITAFSAGGMRDSVGVATTKAVVFLLLSG